MSLLLPQRSVRTDALSQLAHTVHASPRAKLPLGHVQHTASADGVHFITCTRLCVASHELQLRQRCVLVSAHLCSG